MQLKSIETRDEIAFRAFGDRTRCFEVGTPPCARLELDLPCRVVWLWVTGQAIPHGVPLEQVRRFSPVDNPIEELAEDPPKAPVKLSVVKSTGAPKPSKK